jgi:hypothetical protein
MGGFGDKRFNMGYTSLTQKMNLHVVTVQQQKSFLKLCKVTADGRYTDVQLYNCRTALYCKLLPNKCSDLKKVPSKTGMKTNEK